MKKVAKGILTAVIVYAVIIVLILATALLFVMVSFSGEMAQVLFGWNEYNEWTNTHLVPWAEMLWEWFVAITPGG